MPLRPLDAILKEVSNFTEEDRPLAEKLHVALDGGMKRDIFDNQGKPITIEMLDGITQRFSKFMSDPKNQDLLLKS